MKCWVAEQASWGCCALVFCALGLASLCRVFSALGVALDSCRFLFTHHRMRAWLSQ